MICTVYSMASVNFGEMVARDWLEKHFQRSITDRRSIAGKNEKMDRWETNAF